MPNSFEDELECLKRAWLREGGGNESLEELGRAILDFILRRERLRYRIQPGTPEADQIDRLTWTKLHKPDVLEPEHSVFEVFIRRFVTDSTEAVRYITKHVEDRSAAQAKRASGDREASWDGITRLITDFVESNPDAPAKVVAKYLINSGDVVFLGGEYRHKHDGSTATEKALVNRVSRSKHRLRKNSREPG